MITPTDIKSVPWVKEKERNIDIAIQSFYMIGQDQKYFELMGASLGVSNHLAFHSGKLYFDEREIQKAKEYVLGQKNIARWAKTITRNFLLHAQHYEKIIFNTPSALSFQKQTREELATWYEGHRDSIYSLVPYSFVISMILESVARDLIVKELSQHSKEPDRLYQSLIVAKKPNTTNLEYRARLKLACLYEKFGEDFAKKAKKSIDFYLKRFCWLSYYRPIDNPVTSDTLIRMIKETVASKRPLEELEKIKMVPDVFLEAQKILTELHLPPMILSLIKVMQRNVWIRTYRRELMSHAFYLARDFYTVVAEKLHANRDDFRYIACWELPEILRSGTVLSKEEIASRKTNFALVKYNGDVSVIGGSDVDSYEVAEHKVVAGQVIKGKVVFPGVVTGHVRIVRTSNDAQSFKVGDILVAPTVAVWMTPLVERCSGIITDAGGVLSHTAVVAREFRKPCIVGTLHATDVLKNDMIITLDANKGVIIPS